MKENLYSDKVRLFSGKYVCPISISIDEIDIIDIAHGLAMKPRFNGNIRAFYSIADHSVWCADMAKKAGLSERLQLLALLHDASEAYLFDIPSPVKPKMKDLANHITKVQRLIDTKYLGDQWYRSVDEKKKIKAIDIKALEWEWETYMLGTEPLADKNWRHSKWKFLKRFFILGREVSSRMKTPPDLMRDVSILGSKLLSEVDETMFYSTNISVKDYLETLDVRKNVGKD